MKKILAIILVLVCFISFGQKHLIKNNVIVQSGLPDVFTRENGQTIFGGYRLLTEIHYEDGWRDEVVPEYNQSLQRLGAKYYNQSMDKVTYPVIDKTVQELADEKENLLKIIEQEFDVLTVKRILAKVTKPLLESDSITEQDIQDLSMLYPQYRVGKNYIVGEVFALDSDLFKVIQAHTSQADWIPSSTPALYSKYTPPGQVAEWVQPTGAQDAYNIGDKVSFQGSIYESLINANVWSPTAYPQGWKKL